MLFMVPVQQADSRNSEGFWQCQTASQRQAGLESRPQDTTLWPTLLDSHLNKVPMPKPMTWTDEQDKEKQKEKQSCDRTRGEDQFQRVVVLPTMCFHVFHFCIDYFVLLIESTVVLLD
jgi:hypothetical protein